MQFLRIWCSVDVHSDSLLITVLQIYNNSTDQNKKLKRIVDFASVEKYPL